MSDSPTEPAVSKAASRLTPGCLMLIIGLVWIGALAFWMLFSMKRQLDDIRSFADEKPVPVLAAQPTAEEVTALQGRLTAYADAVKAGTKADLRLSPVDLNNLIATTPKLKGLREVVKVTGITDALQFQVSLAMNGVPFLGQRYYLNGVASATLEKQNEKGAMLNTKSVEIAQPTETRRVSEGFLKTYREHNPLDGLILDEVRNDATTRFVEILKATTALRLEAGQIVLDFAPPLKPAAPAAPAPAAP